MWKITKHNTRICIFHEGKIYKISLIWYSKDGGYFIQDFSDFWKMNYIVTKIKVLWNMGEKIKNIWCNYEDTYTVKLSKPKLSHHFDGKAHISWNNITSWYYENWDAKWLSIQSMHLMWKNDGWPLFSINVWSKIIEEFEELELTDKIFKKPHMILSDKTCLNLLEDKENKNYAYVIDWYYIPKSDIPVDWDIENWLIKMHPNFWPIPVFPIDIPLEIPGIIVIHYRKDSCFEDPNFFSFWGAPWLINDEWNWEQIVVIWNIEDIDIHKTLDRKLD